MKKLILTFIFLSSIQVFAQESDPKAIELADKVMKALGGTKAWDNTRHITWNFFGSRRLVWDKWTGNVRVDNLRDGMTSLININTETGKIFKNGTEITQPDSVAKYVKRAKGAWINDSYWLVMPYKLRDDGVTLKYIGKEKTQDGKDAEVIQLTFKNVGNTPDNKYKVFIDPASNLVVQWQYFAKFTDEKPGFTLPWQNYKPYGKILLSGDRGERKLTDIKVFEALPDAIYQSFDKPDFSKAKDFNTKKDTF
ncbi:MAG: hypothetical protein MUF45_02180 [Spirosomaceae bacterium]|jgi:hypothetical protein|nr:hypothetical protein [Spirosomataceae bacterium]